MKIFKVLHKLRKIEQNRFKSFLASPYFNKRRDVILLFDLWILEKGKRKSPKEYWEKLFPEESFVLTKWHLLSSRLFKLLEEYMTIEELRKKRADKKFYLAKAYRSIQEEKLFKEAVRDTNLALEKQEFRNMDYLQGLHELAYEKYDYIISINRKEKSNLQEVSDHFDTYVIATKLRQACYALSREIINQESYKIGLLEEVIQKVDDNPSFLEIPAIVIYYYCYLAISSKDNEFFFQQLRESITRYQQYFPPSEMRDIYTVAINYSIRKLNTGSTLFVQEAFELYLLSLEQGFLLDEGIMPASTYSNLVFLATKLAKYEWANTFIRDYQKHLQPESRIPLFHYSLGKLYYEQGLPTKSLQQLIQVETKASFLHLGARILQLKIYYETEEIDPLESLLESLRVYLQRSKDLAYRKAHYTNILVFTKQLLQLPAMNRVEKEALRERIREAEIFAEKDWFLRMVG